jgi:hypothetical protein
MLYLLLIVLTVVVLVFGRYANPYAKALDEAFRKDTKENE